MWHRLRDDERGRKICATEDCCVIATWRFEYDDVGSFFCSACKTKIDTPSEPITELLDHGMSHAQIKHVVDRFLGWRLPDDFHPDGGVSFKKTFNDHMPTPMKNEPIGTNIFDAQQATAMVRYMLEGLPEA